METFIVDLEYKVLVVFDFYIFIRSYESTLWNLKISNPFLAGRVIELWWRLIEQFGWQQYFHNGDPESSGRGQSDSSSCVRRRRRGHQGRAGTGEAAWRSSGNGNCFLICKSLHESLKMCFIVMEWKQNEKCEECTLIIDTGPEDREASHRRRYRKFRRSPRVSLTVVCPRRWFGHGVLFAYQLEEPEPGSNDWCYRSSL